MVDPLSIALTGLTAQSRRLAATASNIANATTVGALPTAQTPASTVYKPLNVSFTALTVGSQGSGVMANISADEKGYSPAYDLSNPYANSEGLVAVPNVDLNREMVNLVETKALYKANISVIKAQSQMLGDLIDTIG